MNTDKKIFCKISFSINIFKIAPNEGLKTGSHLQANMHSTQEFILPESHTFLHSAQQTHMLYQLLQSQKTQMLEITDIEAVRIRLDQVL